MAINGLRASEGRFGVEILLRRESCQRRLGYIFIARPLEVEASRYNAAQVQGLPSTPRYYISVMFKGFHGSPSIGPHALALLMNLSGQ